MKKADEVQILKYCVHNVAHGYGKTATFMPKPLVGDNGSGMHVHQSLQKEGKALFAGDKYGGLSDTALYYIGGIIKHAKALNAITNPGTNSYKRLVPGFEAPVMLAYSARNRSASIRIPWVSNPKARRIEVRFPDSSANPYFAFAAMMMAGLDGIQNKIHPGDPADKDLYDLEPEEAKHIPTVCHSLDMALEHLDKDREFLTRGGVFTNDVIDAYIGLKMQEITRFRMSHPPGRDRDVLQLLSARRTRDVDVSSPLTRHRLCLEAGWGTGGRGGETRPPVFGIGMQRGYARTLCDILTFTLMLLRARYRELGGHGLQVGGREGSHSLQRSAASESAKKIEVDFGADLHGAAAAPHRRAAATPQPAVPSYSACESSCRQNDEVFFNAQSVTARVRLEPELRPGIAWRRAGWQACCRMPYAASDFTLTPVYRGTHTLMAVVEDARRGKVDLPDRAGHLPRAAAVRCQRRIARTARLLTRGRRFSTRGLSAWLLSSACPRRSRISIPTDLFDALVHRHHRARCAALPDLRERRRAGSARVQPEPGTRPAFGDFLHDANGLLAQSCGACSQTGEGIADRELTLRPIGAPREARVLDVTITRARRPGHRHAPAAGAGGRHAARSASRATTICSRASTAAA